MIPNPSLHWDEILAAYADGEFEGRDDLALLKQRVESWLATHPDAQAKLNELRQLKLLWQETTPPSPAPSAWQRILRNMERTPARTAPLRRRWAVACAAAAACIALGTAIWWAQRPESPQVPGFVIQEERPLTVAAAHEVEILDVEGADTHTLVVGELPVKGPLTLAVAGEVTVTSVQPAARDNMLPEVRMQGPGRPMIWARLETD